jgi:hypothetical protein
MYESDTTLKEFVSGYVLFATHEPESRRLSASSILSSRRGQFLTQERAMLMLILHDHQEIKEGDLK